MKKRRTTLCLLTALSLLPAVAMAEVSSGIAFSSKLTAKQPAAMTVDDQQSKADLVQRLKTIKEMSANFTQHSRDVGKGKQIKVESGVMQLKRPNLFRWDVKQPFAQQIIAEHGRIWMIDPDFQQVIIKAQNGKADPTAVQLLNGDTAKFLTAYTVQSKDISGKSIFVLTPKGQADLFEKLSIIFQKDQLQEIIVADVLGGARRIIFDHVVMNKPLSDTLFSPNIQLLRSKGFDVIDETSTL